MTNLAPQRPSVIARIRRAQEGVDVELGGLGVRQEDAGVVVELGDDDGALHAVVERVGGAVPADPAEVRLGEDGPRVGKAQRARRRR
ncbi:hypothetical protein ONZ43_g1748 [Nemania bipapillata]|uniref:Uncharacterized protein n=1 Tax=Nemania bipapillata TaxID=110536 RepID=A0ACC2J3E1_9PEZI|nr:hypothetical protein ONZ43_g1748 [Nemania bipapillata]